MTNYVQNKCEIGICSSRKCISHVFWDKKLYTQFEDISDIKIKNLLKCFVMFLGDQKILDSIICNNRQILQKLFKSDIIFYYITF